LSYYKRLSFEEREEISRLIESGSSFREIALKLNRNVSTISRDISRFSKGSLLAKESWENENFF
jgi:IS30 family transposase